MNLLIPATDARLSTYDADLIAISIINADIRTMVYEMTPEEQRELLDCIDYNVICEYNDDNERNRE
jgi:hypothetical protein